MDAFEELAETTRRPVESSVKAFFHTQLRGFTLGIVGTRCPKTALERLAKEREVRLRLPGLDPKGNWKASLAELTPEVRATNDVHEAIALPNGLARMPERKAVWLVAQESDILSRFRNSLAPNDLQRSIASCIPLTIRLA